MKVFFATIRALSYDPIPNGRCIEIELVDKEYGEDTSLQVERFLRESARKGEAEASCALEDGAAAFARTKERAKELATKVWLEQEADLISWEDE